MASSPSHRVVTQSIQKPDLDDRSYKLIKLPNDLTALLIHDPTTDKSAASLDCNVGAFNDPKNLPGLAHFLEHLLFMGTEKYPNENDYSSYLSQHSGHSNAYTSSVDTNYYFEINYNYLEGALDRFAQFFIKPLFNKNCKDREIKAVDSENKKNLQNDMWRLSQLDKSLASPNHPYNGFSTGNLQTLGELPLEQGVDVRDELIKFYEAHYSSNLMKLVVLGREDLDTLTEWVVSNFSQVPNKNKQRPVFDNPPLTNTELTKLIKARPVMDTKSLEVTFTTADQSAFWETQPQHYYSHLIGHEGKGSLLFHLKNQGWASGLSAGSMKISKGYSVFSISVDLTDKGLQHYETIVLRIFQYIKMLQSQQPQQWIFDELKDVSALNFKFKQKSGASGTVSKLSSVLNKIDDSLPDDLILSQNVLRKYAPDLIKSYGDSLTTANFRIMLVSPTFTNLPLREKWYGTEYNVEEIDQELLHQLDTCAPIPELKLPAPNEFIPKNFDVTKQPAEVTVPAKAPVLIRSNSLQKLWYKKDEQFWVPKGTVATMFHLPISQTTPLNSLITTIYLELVDDFLNDIAYDASIVGLHFGLNPTRDGFALKITGYNDKLTVLLEKVIMTLQDFKPTQERFELIKEKTLKEYKNFGFSVPYGQIGYYSTTLLYDQTWTIEEKIELLQDLQLKDVLDFLPLFYKQAFLETFVHGNFHKETALSVWNLYETRFAHMGKISESQALTGRSTLIHDNTKYRFEKLLKDEKNVNSCIEYFIQLGELTEVHKLTLADLLAQVSHEPCFNELRTKQQLGYVVFSGVKKTRTTFGYRVLIQSERTTEYLEYRIDEFLAKFGTKLAAFTEEELQKNIESLIAKKTQKLKNLNDEFSKIWGKIGSGYYDFHSSEAQVEILNKTTLADLVQFYNEQILTRDNSKLIVHLKAHTPPKQDAKKLIDITIANEIPDIASNKLEELVKAYEWGSYTAEEIDSFLKSKPFQDLVSDSSVDLTQLQNKISSDLVDPVPQGYPSGKLITSISEFKSENILTQTARPVVPLEQFMEGKEEVNGNAKL